MRNKIIFLLAFGFGILLLSNCKNEGTYQEGDWPVYLGDKSSSHYSGLKQIDTNNVIQLKIAWIYHTGDTGTSGRAQECNPIEINGVLYGTSPRLKLFALDATNGKSKWVFDPFKNIPNTLTHINSCRGVVYWSDGKQKAIFYCAGYFLLKVDAQTGKLVTPFGDSGKVDLHKGLGRDADGLYIADNSPGIIYKDLLILGSQVSETNPSAPGDIRAYDVHTGKIRWIFHTIPHPGETGYDTWEDKNAWEHTGGANCWAGMSLDEKRGIVYAPLGSASYDFYGGLRKGKDLFANCLVALDATTGKLIWFYQTVHHDLWDRDIPSRPNLVTIEHDGKKVDAVAQITKTGYVFVFNRVNGKPLFPIKETPVPVSPALPGEQPWPTQPIPQLPKQFVEQQFTESNINPLVPDSSKAEIRKALAQLQPDTNMFLPPSEKGTVIFPGFDGGGEWGGAAFDPTTGLLYVNANQVPWSLTMVKNISENESKHKHLTVAEHGHAIYISNCMVCHGVNREGGGDYPSLQNVGKKYSAKEVLGIISTGRSMMPSFKQISEIDKKALVSFLLNLKNGNDPFIPSNNKERNGPLKNKSLMPYFMTGYKEIRTPEGYPASKPPWGILTAIDLNTGNERWKIPFGEYPQLMKKGFPITGTENYGGPVATSGGLLIIAATLDQKIRAFNKRTGKLLWEAPLPVAGFATPSTYMVNGKQYIVIACGGGRFDTKLGDTYVAFAIP